MLEQKPVKTHEQSRPSLKEKKHVNKRKDFEAAHTSKDYENGLTKDRKSKNTFPSATVTQKNNAKSKTADNNIQYLQSKLANKEKKSDVTYFIEKSRKLISPDF